MCWVLGWDVCGLSWITHIHPFLCCSVFLGFSFVQMIVHFPFCLFVVLMLVVVVVSLFCCDSVISNRFEFEFCQDLIGSLFFWCECVEKWFSIGRMCLWRLLGLQVVCLIQVGA